MTLFVSLITASLALLLVGFAQFGQVVALHQSLHHRAESLAVIEATNLHKGEPACIQVPVDVVDCRVENNIVSVEVQGVVSALGRPFTLKNRASVGNQWVEFLDPSLP